MNLIFGNLCSLGAMVSDSISSTRKNPKTVLWVQCLSQVFYGLSTLFLGGYSASVQNVVSLIRNLVAIRGIEKKWLEWTLLVLGVIFGFYFNTLGIIGVLPILANVEFTFAVFRYKDNERALKIAFLFNVIMFIIFNTVIRNFIGLASNIVVLVTLMTYLAKNRKTST